MTCIIHAIAVGSNLFVLNKYIKMLQYIDIKINDFHADPTYTSPTLQRQK